MLQHIHDKTKGWFTTTIITVICITFIFWGVHSFVGDDDSMPNRVAKVDGVSISNDQLNATYNRLREQQQIQLGANFVLTDALSQQLHQTALEQLVSSQALSTAALNDGLRFTPNQVGSVIAGISAFQDSGHFSPSHFAQAIAGLGFTEQGFYNDVRNAMLINQMRVGIVGSNFSLPNEIAQALHLINQKRDIQYVVFAPKDFARQVNISPDAIHSYYQQHQDQYKTPEGVALQYLSLDLASLVAKQKSSLRELKDFYTANVNTYTLPAKWQLQTVFLAVTGASDTAANNTMKRVVHAFSHGKDVQAIQLLDASLQIQPSYWLNDKDLDPAMHAVVSQLTEGQVSQPIKTPQGLVVVKLIAKQKAQVLPFEHVKAQVANALAQQKGLQAFSDASEQLSKLTYTDPSNLTHAAEKLALPLMTTKVLTQDSEKIGLWANLEVRRAAFSSDVLAGNNSALINLSDTQAVVIRVLNHVPAAILPEASVSAKIKATLIEQKSAALAKAQADQLVAHVRASTVAPHVRWTVAKGLGRYSSSLNGSIVNAAFQLARPSKVPSLKVFSLAHGAFAVVQLMKITEANDSALTAIQQRVLAEQIASGFAQLDYQLYVNGVMTKAKISVAKTSAPNA